MKYKISIPRTTYDGLVRYLQEWERVYSQPGSTVLRGSLNNPFSKEASTFVNAEDGAARLAESFNVVANVLGQGKVTKSEVTLDLRFLEEFEIEALGVVLGLARLRSSQLRALRRVTTEAQEFQQLPEMVRLALAASD